MAPRIIRFLAIVTCLMTLGFMVHAGNGLEQGIGWWLITAVFFVWACGPFIMFIRGSAEFMRRHFNLAALLAVMAFFFISGAFIYYDAFFVNIDAQNALLFVFIPVYQWLVLFILYVMTYVFRHLFRKNDDPPSTNFRIPADDPGAP